MGSKLVAFIFFANYFVGLLAVALSVETAFQLDLPLCSGAYYLCLFSATVLYYTWAYAGAGQDAPAGNPRTEWYRTHRTFIRLSQPVLAIMLAISAAVVLVRNGAALSQLPGVYWLMLLTIPLAAILYYGLLPKSIISFNLRNTGWLKAFVIGFVWAGCVNIFPVTMVRLSHGIVIADTHLMFWLFVKNWMFCTVNAIMFDMKDYVDDANIQLKTFAVRIGLTNTIYYVLLPLLLIGLASFLTFAWFRHFTLMSVFLNLIPFLCLLAVAFSLHRPRPILYYLIVIDGLLLVKAVCGMAGSHFG